MIGVMRSWWSEFKEKHNIIHWDQGIKWSRYGKDINVSEVGVEYHFGKNAKRLMLMLEVDNCGEGLYSFRIGIPFLFNCYFTVDAKPNRFTKWFAGEDWSLGGRETGFSLDKEYVRFCLHSTSNGWSSDKNCGYKYISTWRDIVMGEHDSVKGNLRFDVASGSLGPSKNQPEGHPHVIFDVKMEDYVSSYSRWYMFWYHPKWTRISLKPRCDIVVPGKGENSYDQDDEKMGEITFGCDTKTVKDAIIEYNKSLHRYMTR